MRCTGTGSRELVGSVFCDQLRTHRVYKDLPMKTICNTILDKLQGDVSFPREDREDDSIDERASEGLNDSDYGPGDGARCGSEEKILPVTAGGRRRKASTVESPGGYLRRSKIMRKRNRYVNFQYDKFFQSDLLLFLIELNCIPDLILIFEMYS